jgi:predicted DNA-binding transcriptional regulator AlpA
MMVVMVKEADLNRIEVAKDYEILDATALGRRLGFKRDTVLTYLSRRNFRRIPRPNRQLAMGTIWYEKSVREWEAKKGIGCMASRNANSKLERWREG